MKATFFLSVAFIHIIILFVFFLNSVMTTLKLEVILFEGKMTCILWQCTIQDYLVQQDLNCVLKK
jgi:hypothetical protein